MSAFDGMVLARCSVHQRTHLKVYTVGPRSCHPDPTLASRASLVSTTLA